jgi:hypothetical protein
LLHFLALFVATFGGVTAMVDNIREMFGPATWRGSQIATTNFAEFFFQKLSKKSGQPQNERVEAYETEQRGLISLRYDGDFCA